MGWLKCGTLHSGRGGYCGQNDLVEFGDAYDGAGFVNIANATAASYRFFPVAADFNARFRVVASVPGNDLASNEVKLTEGIVEPPTVSIAGSGGTLTVTFTGTLQSSTTVTGTYSDVQGAVSPYTVPAPTGTVFYRSKQ